MEFIDLRSDTFTQPTVEMRKAMAEAECGDDVWDEDITVKHLEGLAAEKTGKDAAIFTASGTMSNLIAILTWCDRGTEIVVGDQAHIFWNEGEGFPRWEEFPFVPFQIRQEEGWILST